MPLPTPCLILVAAPSEAEAVARAASAGFPPPAADWQPVPLTPNGRFLLARTGVGKVNAASAAVLLARTSAAPPACVLNLGIGGALPTLHAPPLSIGTLVLGTSSLYADEGVQTPDRFLDIADVGFPPGGNPPPEGFNGSRITADSALLESCRQALVLADLHPVTADIATVSTCSGTDALARAVADRTAAAVEAMEGAAIAHALGRAPAPRIPFCEIRVISNTTGDRARQAWDIRASLARLSDAAAALMRSQASA